MQRSTVAGFLASVVLALGLGMAPLGCQPPCANGHKLSSETLDRLDELQEMTAALAVALEIKGVVDDLSDAKSLTEDFTRFPALADVSGYLTDKWVQDAIMDVLADTSLGREVKFAFAGLQKLPSELKSALRSGDASRVAKAAGDGAEMLDTVINFLSKAEGFIPNSKDADLRQYIKQLRSDAAALRGLANSCGGSSDGSSTRLCGDAQADIPEGVSHATWTSDFSCQAPQNDMTCFKGREYGAKGATACPGSQQCCAE